MKNAKYVLSPKSPFMITLFFAFLLSCNGQSSDSGETNTEVINQKDTIQNNEEKCEIKLGADDFDNFLGITYGMNELLLESKLGAFTGGEYSADSLSFIYFFKKIKGAPITVWVDAETQQVITIFMEILGYEELFQSDLDAAIKEYNISWCDYRFFGIRYPDLKELFGEPAKEDLMKDGVRSVDYDSKDYKYSVNFKFYPDQDNMCSSVSVNWFY